jgi:outer membrane protein OmpA-like peptidoglycan-associated protein
MHNNQSSYSRWTWIVAILLALILLWMLLTGRGPSATCCGAPADPVAPAEVAAAPASSTVTPVAEPFSFKANSAEFTTTGDSTGVAWLGKADALKSLLAGGADWAAGGSAKSVSLTGTVDSEATKQAKGEEAQALFGSDVTIDNQLAVKAPEPVVEAVAPQAAKLYFETAKTSLPADSSATLEPIITWLNANPQAKAVISGYHDSRGSKAKNEKLAKNRAQATYDALVAAGIDAARIEMRKPAETEGDGNLDEARRVEVSVE